MSWWLALVVLASSILCAISNRDPEIDIVYYTFIHPQRWSGILPGQLSDIAKSGMMEKAHLSVIFTLDEKQKHLVPRIKESVRNSMGAEYLSVTTINHTFTNHYEYTGLKLMHDRAVEHPNRLFLYFHGKGMVFHRKPNGQRIPEELLLHHQVIEPWKMISGLFHSQPEVQKAGFTCSPEGYVWFNYFWIRGSYLANCRPPTLSNERYQYEHYIADHCTVNSVHTCLNLVNLNASNNATKAHYTGLEALTIMNGIISNEMGHHYNGW